MFGSRPSLFRKGPLFHRKRSPGERKVKEKDIEPLGRKKLQVQKLDDSMVKRKTRKGYFLTLDAIASMLLLLSALVLVQSLAYRQTSVSFGAAHLASGMVAVIDKGYGPLAISNTTGLRLVVESMPACASATVYNSSLGIVYTYQKQGCVYGQDDVHVAYRTLVNDTGSGIDVYLLEGKVWRG